MGELADRRAQTEARTKELRSLLDAAAKIAEGKACVYATGSFGRREASAFSDLDVFIVAKCDKPPEPEAKRQSVLNPLDGILIKAELIRVGRHLRFPDFTGDGRYLVQYSVKDFTETLGTPEDDVTNTFTAKLLLLLESCPLVGSAVYDDVIDEVVSEYWRDYEGHENDFIPAFLANDILRLWRTLCVNYEARTERTPELEKAKRKLKNFKLKHSRLLTCYSALLYLLALDARQGSVSQQDAIEIIRLTPTERLECLQNRADLVDAKATIGDLLGQYEGFLMTTNAREDELIECFLDKQKSRDYMLSADKFGDLMFEALNQIGNRRRLHRLVVV